MAVHIIGGEMGSFVPSDSTTFETASLASGYDSSFARCATLADFDASFAETPIVATFAATAWAHFELWCNTSANDPTPRTRVTWIDGAGVERLRIRTVETTGTFSLDYFNGTTWVAVGSAVAALNTRQTIDLQANINSASGSLGLYFAGTKRISSGTIDLSNIASLRQVRFYGDTYISQVILADEPTVGMRLGTVVMTGAGSSTDWTGDFTAVDELRYSDSDFIWSDTAGQVEMMAGTSIAPLTGYSIRAVGIAARAKKGGSGPTNLQLALRAGGTNYFSASQALDFGYGAHVATWETNPHTTLPFTSSDLATLQYGVRSVA